jgi:MFS family permease
LSPMSETFGRCPVFLSSFAIYTAFTLGRAQAPNWPTFLLFRFLTGCGASAPKMVTGMSFVNLVHFVIAFPMRSALNDDDV